MSALDALRAARERIARPESWTTGAAARDSKGHETPFSSDTACRWCAIGALKAVSIHFEDFSAARTALKTKIETWGVSIPEFNDTHTHAEVLALFDKAIAAEEVSS